MRLFVAEKPSMARSIAEALGGETSGNGYIQCGSDVVTWCIGHLLEQAKPEEYDTKYKTWRMEDLPIMPSQWKLNPRRDAAKQVKVIGDLVAKASEIIHAGDPDREGQLLVDEVLQHVGCRAPVQRIWLQELNAPGIKKALAKIKPNSEYRGLLDSAIGRSRADWLLGMNMTRAYTLRWQQSGGDGPMHTGRVQTPTLGLVVSRDKEIETFVPKDIFTGLIRVRHANSEFIAAWKPPEGAQFLDAEGRVISEAAVKEMVKRITGKDGALSGLKTERKRIAPPLPYSLAELQKDANKKLGLSPQQVLDTAQSLYETHKLTSYPRSDCQYLPEAEHANAKAVLMAAYENYGAQQWAATFPGKANVSLKSGAWNDKKLGAHYGIIPTTQRRPVSKLSSNEADLYGMIVRRYLAQFHSEYEYDSTSVTVAVGQDAFLASGQAEAQIGWRVLYPLFKKSGDDEWRQDGPLPGSMSKGDAVKVLKSIAKKGKTTPPSRYDGASLIEAMQKAHLHVTDPVIKSKLKAAQGIGTEATRAGIIQNLVERGYLQERKKTQGKGVEFISSDRGRALVSIVDERLSRVDLTAWFEGYLDDVLVGKVTLAKFEEAMRRFVQEIVASAKTMNLPQQSSPNSKPCPKCGKSLVIRQGTKGQFWACRGYPDCRHSENLSEIDIKATSPASAKRRRASKK